jgi:Undecaprenyl-phosphate galactose phosphotransferase WbaP
MTSHPLAPEQPFAARVALAKARASTFARRMLGNAAALAAADLLALTLALLLGGVARTWSLHEPAMVLGASWVVLPLYLGGAALAGLLPGYGLGIVEELRRVTGVLVGVFALAVVGQWLAGPGIEAARVASRLSLGLAGVLALALVPYVRTKAKTWLIQHDRWGVPVVVYGAGPAGALVVRQLQEERGMGYVPAVAFDDDPDRWGDHLDTVPIVGDTGRVTHDAAVAFLAMPGAARDDQIALLEGPLACYGTVVVVPDLFEAPSLWVKPRDLVGVLGLEVTSNLARPFARLLKRALDLGLAGLTAPLWAPLVAALAGLVWLEDRHAPFFRQERVGKGGRLFHAWKLRTMVPDADAALARALDADPALRAEWEAHFKLARDPRITRVGAFLRKTSLDELPQLLNVLRGEMSLVGPRPLPRYHHDELEARVRALRAGVRPGITGLWQVSGRSDAGTLGMERWDPYYVRNWSLWLDLVILVRTFRVVLRGSGAY